jgi:uncharacterized protein with beta-barrel porin domain
LELVIALVLALIASARSEAAERVWDGNGRSSGWTDGANWTGLGNAPVPGDSMRFPPGALKLANVNDFPAGTIFTLLTYAGAGYTASGNEIGLTGGIVVSHGAGNTVLNLPINVEANQAFTVSLAGANLFLNGSVDLGRTRSLLTFDGAGQTIVSGNISGNGVIIGGGAIRKNGSGSLWILQHLTLGGSTLVNGGTLRVDGSLSNSTVTVNAGATLLGTGTVGGLTANSGGAVSPGGASPDILDSLGGVALNAGSTFNVRLNGNTPGLNYDQLRVQGTVTLGGTLTVTAAFVPAVGQLFTIIENDGTEDVIGTFAGLPEGAVFMVNGRPFQISYGARGLGGIGRDVNDVVLEAVPGLSVWDRGGGQNTFWSQPLNWVGDVAPMPGDDVQFANAGSGTLTTINDFPAGRAFGSIIFAGGNHHVEGNLAGLAGNIQVTQPGDAKILMPMSLAGGFHLTQVGELTLSGPVVLSESQSFWVDHSNASLRVEGPVDLAGHSLTLRNVPGGSLIINAAPLSVRLLGGVSGAGSLIKEGSGDLYVEGLITCPLTTVNAGTLDFEGRFYGKVVINPGTRLQGGFFLVSGLTDVDVHGGTFAPSFGTHVYGTLRVLEGSTFEWAIVDQGANGIFSTYAYVDQPVELTDCNLSVSISPNTLIEPGTEFPVIVRFGGPPANGVFNGLPEGARFVLNGYVFTITYHGGTSGTYVNLIAEAPFVWDGGGSGIVWTTAANWVGDLAPLANHDLVFPAGVSKLGTINDFAPGTSFRSLTFGGPSYVIVGNSFRLIGGIFNDFASGETVVTADFVVFGDAFECRVGNASRLRLEGSVTRSAANANWRKTGTGTLLFTGAAPNSQSDVEVWAGELELAKSPGVDAISTRLGIGDGTNVAVVTLLDDNQIADSADVTVRAPARFELNGSIETIDILSGNGTVALTERSLRAGRLTVGSGSFSGNITGNGGLTKAGAAASGLALTGTNTFTGITILSGGQLQVEGAQTNSPIRLDGGVLTGRGWVGTITGNLGGTVQPGFHGTTFQNRLHSRDVAFNSATTFRPLLTSVDADFDNSQLQVSGAVNLGGSALTVDLLGSFKPAPGRSFVIIENDGADPIMGTFANLPEGAVFGGAGLPFRISYVGGTGNDVVLTRVATPPSALSSITALGNGQVSIEGLGMGGVVYSIQAASNLNPIILWTPVGSGTGNVNGIFYYLDTSAPQRTMRFYRAVAP